MLNSSAPGTVEPTNIAAPFSWKACGLSGAKGSPRFGALGLVMLPVKEIDTLQPIYGLSATALLLVFLATGRMSAALPAAGLSRSASVGPQLR
jgi:hypothetical protein